MKILFASIPQPRNRFVRDLQEGMVHMRKLFMIVMSFGLVKIILILSTFMNRSTFLMSLKLV